MIPPPSYQGGAFVYLLRSRTTGNFYIGTSTNPQRRLDQHNAGRTVYTSKHRPWELLGGEAFPTLAAARRREAALKRSSRMRLFFIKRTLNGSPVLRKVGG